ncbi:hypothetical protein OGAPHI_006680 [Ogataea philodendri]|uniref:Asparaginase n=1 Tax=Ogataea philodendri TaxID=1378263 RepID=A0A9P8NWQ7_9ASCO|nr:uncharacterized protein OGAPHI_006680 [Ogataea philodendri]KAH3661273.1 hypothetical protein OGAPHI_006680 [Ogataea philodendri]
MSDKLTLVHFGAGNHTDPPDKFRRLFRRAIRSTPASRPLFESQLAELVSISQTIEESPLTNTGLTSSVARDGSIQCDSSVFVYNRTTLKHTQSSLLANTSAHPTTDCAIQYVLQQNQNDLGLTAPVALVGKTDRTLELNGPMKQFYDKFKPALCKIDAVDRKTVASIVSDTIGVSLVGRTTVTTGVSSGGSLFKRPGRIGCSGVVGAGCYTAQQEGFLANVLCSGNGEDIIQMDLARTVCRHLLSNRHSGRMTCDLVAEAAYTAAEEVELRALDENYKPRLYVGVCGYFEAPDNLKCVFYFHTTETFVFGYSTSLKSEFLFSKLPKAQTATKGQMYVK